MSTHAPNPANPFVPTEPTQRGMRRDTLVIVAIGVALAAGAGTFAFRSASGTETLTTSPPATEQSAAPSASVAPTQDLTLAPLNAEDAASIVTEARDLMRAARWDEATSRLELVEGDLARTSGASALLSRVAALRVQWNQLSDQLERHVEAQSWASARQTVVALEAIATLDQHQLDLKTQTTDALAAIAQERTAARSAAKVVAETGRANGGTPSPTPDTAASSTSGAGETDVDTTTTTTPAATDEPQAIDDMAADIIDG